MKGLDTMVNTNYALQKKKKRKKTDNAIFCRIHQMHKKGVTAKKTNNRVSNEMKCYTKCYTNETHTDNKESNFLFATTP